MLLRGLPDRSRRWRQAAVDDDKQPTATQAQRRYLLSYFPWGCNGVVQAAPGTITTWCYALPLDDDIAAVALCLAQPPGGPEQQITAASCVVSSSVSDYLNPTGGAPVSPFTWNNRGAWSDIVNPYNSAGNVTSRITDAAPSVSPMTGGLGVWQPDWSDFVSVQSVAPVPGGRRYLFIRILMADAPYFRSTVMRAGWTGVPAINGGYDIACLQYNGDGNTGFPVIAAQQNYLGPLFGIQVLSRAKGICVMASGDSKFGSTVTAGMNNFLNQLWKSWPTPSVPFAPCFANVNGHGSNTYWPFLMNLMPAVRPSVAFIMGFTLNDPIRSFWTRGLPRLLISIERFQQIGCVPVVFGPYPDNLHVGGGPMRWTEWAAVRAEILSMAPSTIVIDPVSLVGQQSTPGVANASATQPAIAGATPYNGNILPQLTPDDEHLNDAGHAVIAAAVLPIVRAICGV